MSVVLYCSATGTAELLNHEQEEVDRILADVSVCAVVENVYYIHVHDIVY